MTRQKTDREFNTQIDRERGPGIPRSSLGDSTALFLGLTPLADRWVKPGERVEPRVDDLMERLRNGAILILFAHGILGLYAFLFISGGFYSPSGHLNLLNLSTLALGVVCLVISLGLIKGALWSRYSAVVLSLCVIAVEIGISVFKAGALRPFFLTLHCLIFLTLAAISFLIFRRRSWLSASAASVSVVIVGYLVPISYVQWLYGLLWLAVLLFQISDLSGTVLTRGSDADSRSAVIRQRLVAAVLQGNIPALNHAINAGGDVSSRDSKGWPLLVLASCEGHLGAAELLVAKGADVNANELWLGASALMWASVKGHTEIVGLLLSKGADSHVCNHRGQTALMWAYAGGHDAIGWRLLVSDSNLMSDRDYAVGLLLWASAGGILGAHQN